MSPTKGTRKAGTQKASGFTADEKEAMKERVREMKQEASGKQDGESEVLAKIAAMKEPDRSMAKRLHVLIKATAPSLTPRTWYGMPAYAKDGKVVCFFQSGQKFKSRYATLGFSDQARLDEGAMWPHSYALMALTPTEETRIMALLKRAIG